jgi:SAM-dependent methyltransferase
MIDIQQCNEFFKNHPESRDTNFIEWIKERNNIVGTVANLGCGPGRLDRKFCAVFPDTTIDAFDGSKTMLEIAKENLGTLSNRIQLKHQSLVDVVDNNYDTVISSDTLHHIHDPMDFWSTIKRITRTFYVTDLVRPDSIEQVDRIIRTLTRKNDDFYREDFRNSLCASFTIDEIKSQLANSHIDNYDIVVTGEVCKTVYIYGVI